MIGTGFHFITNFGEILLIFLEEYKLNTIMHIKIHNYVTDYQPAAEPIYVIISFLLLAYAMLSKKENPATK
jgi:hypothetical protein